MFRPASWRTRAVGLSIVACTATGFALGIAVATNEPDTIDGLTRTGPCPEPGLLDVGREAERIETCEAARVAERLAFGSGATAAEARVRFRNGTNALGDERELHAVIRVSIPKTRRATWDGESIVKLIARSIGTSERNIAIHDAHGRVLVDAPEDDRPRR